MTFRILKILTKLKKSKSQAEPIEEEIGNLKHQVINKKAINKKKFCGWTSTLEEKSEFLLREKRRLSDEKT